MPFEDLNPPVGAHRYGITPPNPDELRAMGARYHLTFSDDDIEFFSRELDGIFDSYRRVSQMTEPRPEVMYPRTPGYRPEREDNPLNAWYWRCSVKGAASGILAGKTVALKDNIPVAGVPMMSGTGVLEGLVPDADATLVTRILDAGGEIVGKAVCEDHSMSSWPSAHTGPVLNPNNPDYSTGGSSSGSAALVGNGDVDMAIGGDQGGSIRIPASFCGIYGMKPTHGLIPYTGIIGLDNTIDHAGPMARTVLDLALLLEAVAGKDPLDPRQNGDIPVDSYSQLLTVGAGELRFGLLQEGFGWDGSAEPDVDEAVRQAALVFAKLGASVHEVSVPMHRDGVHIHLPIHTDGALFQVYLGNGYGRNWKGYYPTRAIEFYGKSKVARANDYSDAIKLQLLLADYMLERYGGRHYAMAQNLARKLTAAYNAAFQDVDILVMPTTPRKATKFLDNPTRSEHMHTGFGSHWNTSPFNVTGHPALNVPCGRSDGLPIGMMLVGRPFEDSTVLRAAAAFEQAAGGQ